MDGGIEQAELYRPLGEHAVQIEGVIACVVIVLVSATSSVVPDGFQLIHGPWSLVVHLVKETGIGFLAVILPIHLHIQRLIQKYPWVELVVRVCAT